MRKGRIEAFSDGEEILARLRSMEMYDLETLGASNVFMDTAALTAAVAMAAADAMPELPSRSRKDVEVVVDDAEVVFLSLLLLLRTFRFGWLSSSSSSSGVGGRVLGGESSVDDARRQMAALEEDWRGVVVTKAKEPF